jgi:hypothetical protein
MAYIDLPTIDFSCILHIAQYLKAHSSNVEISYSRCSVKPLSLFKVSKVSSPSPQDCMSSKYPEMCEPQVFAACRSKREISSDIGIRIEPVVGCQRLLLHVVKCMEISRTLISRGF